MNDNHYHGRIKAHELGDGQHTLVEDKPGDWLAGILAAHVINPTDARRLAACWNALVGVDTALIEDGRLFAAVAETHQAAVPASTVPQVRSAIATALADSIRSRDELQTSQTGMSKQLRAAATADVGLRHAQLLIGAAETIERAAARRPDFSKFATLTEYQNAVALEAAVRDTVEKAGAIMWDWAGLSDPEQQRRCYERILALAPPATHRAANAGGLDERAQFEAEITDLFHPAVSMDRPDGGEYSGTQVRDMWLGWCLRAFSPAAVGAGDLPDLGEIVSRFLGWPLPKTFGPDCGISFDGRKDDEWNKNKSWPIGTNLLTADEAKAMFEYCFGEKAK